MSLDFQVAPRIADGSRQVGDVWGEAPTGKFNRGEKGNLVPLDEVHISATVSSVSGPRSKNLAVGLECLENSTS